MQTRLRRRFFAILTLLGLLSIGSVEARDLGVGKYFDREVDFRKISWMADHVTLRPGRLIQAFSRANGKLLYQPVVLCESLELNFDGRSETKGSIEGFCISPWQPPAPLGSDVVWEVTEVVLKEIYEEGGCTDRLRREARNEFRHTLAAESSGNGYTCGSLDYFKCRNEFEAFLSRSGETLQDELDNGRCTIVESSDQGLRQFALRCHPSD